MKVGDCMRYVLLLAGVVLFLIAWVFVGWMVERDSDLEWPT